MGAYSFSSLRDMLEQPPSHNSKLRESLTSQYPIPKHQVPHENPPYLTQMFGDLFFKESHSTSSSTQHFLFPPPPPPTSPSPNHTLETNSIRKSTNFGKDKVTENGCVYNKKSWGRNERLFPPPISCLKTAKSGDPIVYFRFDENYSTFVPEERRIHKHGDLLCVSRNSGRLKLYLRHDEPEEEEEEQEENDGKEASDEEWMVVDFGVLCA